MVGTRFIAALSVLLGLLLTSSEARAFASTGHHTAVTAADWPTYGDSLERDGENAGETVLTTATVASLHHIWSYNLGGVVDTSPVMASGVATTTGTRDLVYAGSEHGLFVAIDAHTGQPVWSRSFGSVLTNCTDMPDKVFGITSAPVIDRLTDRIYVAALGKLFAMVLGTGRLVSGWPIRLSADPVHEHVYGALTLFNNVVYAEIASMCDIPPYRGRILAVSTVTPGITAAFYPLGRNGPYGGGIWGWGGASIDPATGSLYVSTGNALARPENLRYAESVLRFSGGLVVTAASKPPNTQFDSDFGSTPIVFHATGCPTQLAVEKKGGLLYLYNADGIASGPAQVIQIAPAVRSHLVGVAAWSSTTQLLYVSDPQSSGGFSHGMLAFSDAAPGCILSPAWQTPAGPPDSVVSPPSIGADVVYYGDGIGAQVHAFNAITGIELWNSGTAITVGVFAAPTVVNGTLYVSGWDQSLHAFGL
jgi:outer membrane protein assembly factor BamB